MIKRQGGNNKPQLSDLRESGSIEQDADMVLFIHRYDYQGFDSNPENVGKTDLIIAKHRNGEIGEIRLMFRSSEVRFVDMEDSLISQSFVPVSSMMNDDDFPSASGSSDFGGNTAFE